MSIDQDFDDCDGRWLLLSSRNWRSQDYIAANAANAADTGMTRKTLFLTVKYLGIAEIK